MHNMGESQNKYVEWKSQTKKKAYTITFNLYEFRKCIITYSDKQQVGVFFFGQEDWDGQVGAIAKGHKENWEEMWIHYLDYGDGFKDVWICQNWIVYFKYIEFTVCLL